MESKFFNWDKPFLPQIIDELIARHTKGKTLDFSDALIVFPVQHAQRRFQTLLVEEVEKRIADGKIDPDWTVPDMTGVENFIERFYEPEKPTADPLVKRAAWRKAIDEISKKEPEAFAALFLGTNGQEDFASRCDRADRLSALYREISANCEILANDEFSTNVWTFASIAAQLHGNEKNQWLVLKDIESLYRKNLRALNLSDTEENRTTALANGKCRAAALNPESGKTGKKKVYLAGIVELSTVQKKILDSVSDSVVSFVFAPPSDNKHFDACGTLKSESEYYLDNAIEITQEHIFQLSTPVGEGVAAARLVKKYKEQAASSDKKQPCIIGVLDEEIRPFLEQELESLNLTGSSARELEPKENRVVQLIFKLARFFKRRQFDAFAELVRHSDFEAFLCRKLSQKDAKYESADWLSALDRYQNRLIPDILSMQGNDMDDRLDRNFEENRQDREILSRLLKIVREAFASFFICTVSKKQVSGQSSNEPVQVGEVINNDVINRVDSKKKLFPAQWIEPFDQLMTAIYSASDEDARKTEQIERGLRYLYSFFDEVEKFPESLAEKISIDELLDIFRRQILLKQKIKAHSSENAEMIGWLNTVFDDRKRLILAGMNDDALPSRSRSFLFLTDSIRERLKMPKPKMRQVIDAYYLRSILANRPDTDFLFARQSLDQSPKRPSRFLLMTKEAVENAARINKYLSNQKNINPALPAAEQTAPSSKKITAPTLKITKLQPTVFRASSFKTFLENPYLWFLQNGLDAETLDDHSEELQANHFGTLIHTVLEQFAKEEHIRESLNEEIIFDFLDKELDKAGERYINSSTSGTVLIQKEMARQRLHSFAEWQAEWRKKGNHILFAEEEIKNYQFTPQVSYPWLTLKQPVMVSGKIDRIDYNEQTGMYYVFDYKTFKQTNKTPASAITADEPWLNARKGNEIEKKYWGRLKEESKLSDQLYEELKIHCSDSKGKATDYRWIDLQLPLYRKMALKLLQDKKNKGEIQDIPENLSKIQPALILLPPNGNVCAYSLDWSSSQESAEATLFWAVQTIYRLWQEGIDPNALIDPEIPELGKILPDDAQFMDKYYGLTLR